MAISDHPLSVCYFGTYRAEYSRNQILIEGLRRAGVEVVECHENLWLGFEDRVQAASGGWARPGFILRVVKTYLQILRDYRHVGHYDVLVVGYPGHFDVFLARLLTWLRHKPLVWDVFNSLYLISVERGINHSSPLTVKLIRFIEKVACRFPELLLLDTPQFVDWFKETHQIEPDHFRLIPIGADDRFFYPQESSTKNDDAFRVIYYGSYIPNHGVEFIVEAARLTASDPAIQYEMVGDGPERAKAFRLAQKYALSNIDFIDWLDRQELPRRIARSDLVLGAFGATRQVELTNNNKMYEGFAMRKPVVSGCSPALPAVLRHKEHLYLCERGNPSALADAIRTLKSDPALCDHLAKNGYRIFKEIFNVAYLGQMFTSYLKELMDA